jgi:hypothetical protein
MTATRKRIADHLNSDPKAVSFFGGLLSTGKLQRALKRHGLSFVNVSRSKWRKEDTWLLERRVAFCTELISMASQGYVIVFHDKSYVSQNHHGRYTYFGKGVDCPTVKEGNGQWLNICDAMTVDGCVPWRGYRVVV